MNLTTCNCLDTRTGLPCGKLCFQGSKQCGIQHRNLVEANYILGCACQNSCGRTCRFDVKNNTFFGLCDKSCKPKK